jgi:diadenosine tetraphosphate (Ap4A) HIT family hydrolase
MNGRRPLPGGTIHRGSAWVVEHCVGPVEVGALVVKPIRHVTRVSELARAESVEMGPLLQRTAAVVDELLHPEQIYVCLWSHAGGNPAHVHYVVQPVSQKVIDVYGARGPHLQAAIFDRGSVPATSDVEELAELARRALARRSS